MQKKDKHFFLCYFLDYSKRKLRYILRIVNRLAAGF